MAAAAVGATFTTIGTTIVTAVPSAHAGSTPRTSSEEIATEAVEAVEAFADWNRSGRASDFDQFEQERDDVATLTAEALGLEAEAVRDNLSSTTLFKQNVVLTAITQLGVPYRSMQSNVGSGFDCSGLTSWAFGDVGVEIPRSSGDQFRAGDKRSDEEAVAGDLVYYPGHIGIYLGGDIYIHSPYSGEHVEITMLPSRSHNFADVVQPIVIREASLGTDHTVPHLVDTTPAGTLRIR
ncbi:MAG TPA: NlpC/P60 family protein [Ilumatobacter sp.]|nr:NlpC/P60 family protein [Ilumatobacter sp.]